MAEAVLPNTGVSEGTGFANADIEKAVSRPLELTGKSIELLGAGLQKTASAVIQPLISTIFGLDPLTSVAGGGIGGLGKLISAGGGMLAARGRGESPNSSVTNNNTTNNKNVDQTNTTNNQTAQPIKIINKIEAPAPTMQQSGSTGTTSTDPNSPLPSMLHPDMRRASRMPVVIRNAAMLSTAVQKRTKTMESDDDDNEDQMELKLDAQEKSTFKIIGALEDQTTMTLEKQEELQPTFLERRQETEMNKRALKEQERTNRLLTQQNKMKATEDKGGGFLSSIMDNMQGVLGGIVGGIGGLFAAGGGLSKLFSFIPSLVKKFAVFGLVINAIEGILDGFRVFQEGGSIGEIIMATIEGFADGMIQTFTFGLLDLEKIQNAVTDGIEWTVNFVKGLWADLSRGLDKVISFLTFGLVDLEDVGTAVSFVFDNMKKGFGVIIDYIKFNFGFLKDLFTGNFEGVFDRVKTVFGIWGDGFSWIGDKITSFFGNLGEIIATVFNLSPLGIAFNFIKKTFEKIPQVAEQLFNSVIDFAKKVLPNWVVDKIFGDKEPTKEEMAQEARTREANEQAKTILNEDTRKTKNPNDLTVGDLNRTLEFQSSYTESPTRADRSRRVSENIAQTNRTEPKAQPDLIQTTPPEPEPQKPSQVAQTSRSEVAEFNSMFENNLSEKDITSITSLMDNSGMQTRAMDRATSTEELSDQVRTAQQASAKMAEQRTLNNMNQVVNAQSYQTNVTKLPPRAEDFNAGVVNRDPDY